MLPLIRLNQFLEAAPSCWLDDSVAEFIQTCDRFDSLRGISRGVFYGVLLDADRQPVGCINLCQAFRFLQAHGEKLAHRPDSSPADGEHQPPSAGAMPKAGEPISTVLGHLIQPVGIFADAAVLDGQIQAQIKQYSATALIDAGGQYLGLLDRVLLLEALVQSATSGDRGFLAKQPEPSAAPTPRGPWTSEAPRTGDAQRAPSDSPNLAVWHHTAEALSQAPVPILIQRGSGEVLSRNQAWMEHFGTWQPWQAQAASPSGTALAVSIAQQNALSLLNDEPSSLHRSLLPDIDIRQTEICDVNHDCGRWEIIRIPIQIGGGDRRANGPQSIRRAPAPSAETAERIWLCLGQRSTPPTDTQSSAEHAGSQVSPSYLEHDLLECLNHELKGAVTALLGLSTLLLDVRVGHLNERQRHYTSLIYRNGQNLKATTNEILDITRAIAGQITVMPVPMTFAEVIHQAYQDAEAYNTLRRKSSSLPQPNRSNRLQRTIQPGLEAIFADELRIRQMLTHLLSNALKHTPASSAVGVTVERWHTWIAITVWDEGNGIEPEQQPYVFQRLQSFDTDTCQHFSGPGAGLILVRQLARLLGGELTFESSDRGSRFTLLLPYRQSPALKTSQPESPSKRNSRFVVLVACDRHVISTVADQLRSLGYHLAIARSNREAIEKVNQIRPHAVCLHPAPALSPDWIIRQIKATQALAQIPLIQIRAASPLSGSPPGLSPESESPPAIQATSDGSMLIPASDETWQRALQRLRANVDHPRPNRQEQLIILYLRSPSRVLEAAEEDLSLILQHYNCRILEVEDVEQADMLVLIWKPQVVLLAPDISEDPQILFKQISQQQHLTQLPFVTLTGAMSHAANQFTHLMVYPYLAPLTLTVNGHSATGHSAEIWPLIDVLKMAAAQGS
ncbi:MAG: sensor histidine kinase [Cyanobacteria bacterium P01_C01_bin.73]